MSIHDNSSFKYKLQCIVTNLSDNSTEDISDYLIESNTHRNYELNKPIYILKFSLPTRIVVKLSTSPKFKLYYNSTSNNASLNSSHIVEDLVDLDEQKMLFLKPFSYTSLQFTRAEIDRILYEEETNNNETLDFVIECFDLNHTQLNEEFANFTIKDSTVEQAIHILFNECKLNFERFNFYKPDNEEVYETIFIPANTFLSGIKYLEETYGIYKTSKSIVFAEEKTLSIRPHSVVVNKEQSEEKYNPINIYCKSDSNEDMFNNEVDNIRPNDIVYTIKPNVTNKVIEKLRLNGSKILYTTEDKNTIYEKETDIDLKDDLNDYILTDLKDKTIHLVNHKRNNTFFLDMYISKLKHNMITTTFNIFDAKENLFDTETMLNVLFENDDNIQYSGLWAINSQIIKYQKSGSNFSCNIILDTYKVL